MAVNVRPCAASVGTSDETFSFPVPSWPCSFRPAIQQGQQGVRRIMGQERSMLS